MTTHDRFKEIITRDYTEPFGSPPSNGQELEVDTDALPEVIVDVNSIASNWIVLNDAFVDAIIEAAFDAGESSL